MKVLLAIPPVERVHPWEGPAFIESVRRQFGRCADPHGHSIVDDLASADAVLYLEPNGWRDRSYAELLLREEAVRRFPEKCFAYNYADFFIGFLPGLYVSLPQRHAADPRFASWSYILGLPNRFVTKASECSGPYQPRFLFSFRGSNTAPVRVELFRRARQWSAFAAVAELGVGEFFATDAAAKQRYVEEILASQFVLCPRGLGPASHRLFETMALGRVPVILSDDWVAPSGPDWAAFSLRVRESEIDRLPEMLRANADRAESMGCAARQAWCDWFAPEVVVPHAFDRLAHLKAQLGESRPDYSRLWRSARFYRPYGLAPEQRLWKNLRSGEFFKKAARRIAGKR